MLNPRGRRIEAPNQEATYRYVRCPFCNMGWVGSERPLSLYPCGATWRVLPGRHSSRDPHVIRATCGRPGRPKRRQHVEAV